MSEINIVDLTVGYNRHPALHHINATLPLGKLIAVMGRNGSGKSTLIKTLAQTVTPMTGTISGMPKVFAYLPQISGLQRDFPITVLQMVATGIIGRKNSSNNLGKHNFFRKFWISYSRDEIEDCVKAIAKVGLSGFDNRNIDTLSGGQLQRALFARLIVQDAQLILLDEPFSAVDERTTNDLLKLLHSWQKQGRTVIVVLHDLKMARENFEYCLLLARELVACGKTTQVLNDESWIKSQNFFEAYDDLAEKCIAPLKEHCQIINNNLHH